MPRTLYIVIVIIYLAIIGAWCYRFPISYKATNGTYHDLVLDHNFTQEERNGLEKAYRIRVAISTTLMISSILISISSYVVLKKGWFQPAIYVKVITVIAAAIGLILILVNGIHFVPIGPIY
jgi:hypothetical protein